MQKLVKILSMARLTTKKVSNVRLKNIALVGIISLLSLTILSCIQKSSANLEEEALLQLYDFFDKQNKLFERQKRYEFQQLLDVKRLDRKRAEVNFQYKFIDNYMTVNRREEIRRGTFLLQWQDKGKLVVTPEGETQRVRWVLSRTWDYDREKNTTLDLLRYYNEKSSKV
jgi:hypothetical protein